MESCNDTCNMYPMEEYCVDCKHYVENDDLLDDLVHIKNFEAMLPDKTFCNQRPFSEFGNAYSYVMWTYPTFQSPKKITCIKCLKNYSRRFNDIEDLSFGRFKNKDFSGRDFTKTSIIGAHFDTKCNLDGALVRSIALTNGLDWYKFKEEGKYYRLVFSSINPYPSFDPHYYQEHRLGHCLGRSGD